MAMSRRIIIDKRSSKSPNDSSVNKWQLKQFYVYLLIDPRGSNVFYVGKGTEDRLFQHGKEVQRGNVETAKQKRINEIHQAGLRETKIVIARFDTEKEAFAVESALIHWVYGKSNLTNDQSGHMVDYIRPKGNMNFLPGIDEPELDYSERERDKRERYEIVEYLKEIQGTIENKFDFKFDGIETKKEKHTYLYKIISGVMFSVVTHHNPRRSVAVTIESLSLKENDRNAVKKLCVGTKLEYRNNGRYARIKAGMVKSKEEIMEQFESTYKEILKAQQNVSSDAVTRAR